MDIVVQLGLAAWTVPAAAVGVPGLLVVIAVLFQLAGGVAWVPVARRSLSGIGVRRGTGPAGRNPGAPHGITPHRTRRSANRRLM
jgi:hypothetical protein